MIVWRRGTISLEVINRAASLASTTEDMTNLMIWEMMRIGPLNRGLGYSLESMIFATAWLRDLETWR